MKQFFWISFFGFSQLMAQTWVGTTAQWGVDSNWTPSPFPNSSSAIATFSTASVLSQPNIGAIDAASKTVGSIVFSAPGGNTISATSPYTLILAGSGTISCSTAGNEISAPIVLNSNLVTTVSQGITLTLSGVITGAFSITAGGAGTTLLNNASNAYTGGTVISSGILQATSDGALGAVAGIQISSGTFQAGASFGTSGGRGFTLSGTATIDSMTNTLTIPGVIQGASLNIASTGGGGTVLLQGANLYIGGTTVSSGSLNITSDGNLGAASGALSLLSNTTLVAGGSFNLSASRSVSVAGSVTINPNGNTPTISGPISGSGSLLITGGSGTLSLLGENAYTGGTTVNTVTLQGNTSSLQGAISLTSSSTLVFSQAGSGTYAGVFNGATGTTLTLSGGGTYTFSGNSSASRSTTSLTGSHLIVTGNLGVSTFAIDATSSLSGTGTLTTSGGITNLGQIIPGSSRTGTLLVSGAITLNSGSGGTLVSELTPNTNGLLQVSGAATLTNGHLTISPDISGFYGLSKSYTLVNAGSIVGTFADTSISDPNFSSLLSYTGTQVQVLLTVPRPFLHFPFANANERSVGKNIDALGTDSLLNADLSNVINSLAGQSNSVIDDALDQMHPAAMSAFAELQAELGGQLLSLFHRRFELACSCAKTNRFWVEPFGNWLKEKQQGMEIGFRATTRGVALGYDHQFFGCWTLGIGGAYNHTDLKWTLDRGYAYVTGAYGSLYSDLNVGNFYLGASAYAGKDWYETFRQIHFTTIDRQAKSNSDGFDVGGQITSAYFFGTPSCLLYPYATVDYLYLKNGSVSENGAVSLDLKVEDYTSSTLRAEAGGAFKFVDRNRDETICISPFIAAGYVLELPLHREHFRASFSGMPISFTTQGWDMAWQLFNLKFGLSIAYHCFSLDSQYIAEISPEGDSPFFNQRANFRFNFSF